jgi:hypothetical protein
MIGSDAVDSCPEIDNQMAHFHHYCPTTPTGQTLAMDRERMREFTIRELIEREAGDVIATSDANITAANVNSAASARSASTAPSAITSPA